MVTYLRQTFTLVIAASECMALSGCASPTSEPDARERQILSELRSEGIAVSSSDRPEPLSGIEGLEAYLSDAGPISLADLLEVAEARSAALAAARSEIGIAAGQEWQASLYPNPRIEFAAEEAPFRTGPRDGVTTIGVVQPVVMGDRLGAAARAADADGHVRRARVELRRREVFGAVSRLHAHLLAVNQALTMNQELAEFGRQTLNIAQTRFEARAATETEVIRPQIELYQIDLARTRLIADRDAAARQLSVLLGGIVIDVDRLSGVITENPPAIELDAIISSVRQHHPAVLLAEREIDFAIAQLERIKSERTPDLDVRVAMGFQGESDEGIFEVGAGIMLPLWDHRQGDVLSARFDLMRARQQRLATEDELTRQLTEAHGAYESARAQLATLQDLLVPAAIRSFEQTQVAYRGGRAEFIELLDAQRTLTEARTALIDLLGRAAVAQAEIMAIAGRFDESTLTHRNLDPEQATPADITSSPSNHLEEHQ